MANESRFKLKLSRIFRTSLGSCRSKHLSDTIQNSVLSPETLQSFRTINGDEAEPLKSRSFSSMMICRTKNDTTTTKTTTEQIDVNNCIRSTMNVMLPTPRPSLRFSHRFDSEAAKPRPSPVLTRPSSSVFPLNPFYEQSKKKKKKRKIKTTKRSQYKKSSKKTTAKRDQLFPFSSSSLDSNLGGWWFSSSDDENDNGERDSERKRQLNDDETETLSSYKTPTSDSSEHRLRRRRCHRKGESSGGGPVKDSFAVVKKSSDPHNDFRTSMVEMIVEKQIFSANDLESLLQCFLSLNSEHHHRVIVEVFAEILEALFSNCGS